MPNEFGGLNPIDKFIKAIGERVDTGELTAQGAMELVARMASTEVEDITHEWKAALIAMGHEDLAMAFCRVGMQDIRIDGFTSSGLGLGGFGLQFSVHRNHMGNLDPDHTTPEQDEVFLKAIVCVLRARNVNAFLRDDKDIDILGPIIAGLHDDDDFESQIRTFMTDVDETLGPSVSEPKSSNGDGWDRWGL